jgi:hypothetical protein
MGIRPEDTAIDVPDNLATYSAAQRREWARRQIEAISLEMLKDIGAMHGAVPTPEQQAAYLRDIRPGIDEALGVAR